MLRSVKTDIQSPSNAAKGKLAFRLLHVAVVQLWSWLNRPSGGWPARPANQSFLFLFMSFFFLSIRIGGIKRRMKRNRTVHLGLNAEWGGVWKSLVQSYIKWCKWGHAVQYGRALKWWSFALWLLPIGFSHTKSITTLVYYSAQQS